MDCSVCTRRLFLRKTLGLVYRSRQRAVPCEAPRRRRHVSRGACVVSEGATASNASMSSRAWSRSAAPYRRTEPTDGESAPDPPRRPHRRTRRRSPAAAGRGLEIEVTLDGEAALLLAPNLQPSPRSCRAQLRRAAGTSACHAGGAWAPGPSSSTAAPHTAGLGLGCARGHTLRMAEARVLASLRREAKTQPRDRR